MLSINCIGFVFLATAVDAFTRDEFSRVVGVTNKKIAPNERTVQQQVYPRLPDVPTIIGGTEADEGVFPYFGHYVVGGSSGVTLIHDDIVITAAFTPLPDDCTIYLDSIALRDGTEATIDQFLIHPDFDGADFWSPNLMLMRLSAIPDSIDPVGYNTDESIPTDGQNVTAIGFGITEETENATLSEELIQVTMSALPGEDCAAFYGLTDDEAERFICTSEENRPCFGDIGGPVLNASDGSGVVVGVIQDVGLCLPTQVYTRLSSFESWIDEAICCMSNNPPDSCGDETCSDIGSIVSVNCSPENEECETAISLEIGDQIIASTDDATFAAITACGANTSIGLWYSVTGDGSELRASTCDRFTTYDTRISVYEGSCGNLTCVTENLDDSVCPFMLRSTATWFSEEDTVYYIHVYGYENLTGTFLLSVDSPEAPFNDNCSDALFIPPGFFVEMSTIGSTEDDVEICDGALDTGNYYGVWYNTSGVNGTMRASTCGLATLTSGFDTQLLVYSGDCEELECVGGNDDANDDSTCSELEWESEEDEEYFIYVVGFDEETGNFALLIEEVFDPPENDECEDAIALELGDQSGTTLGATFDNVDSCLGNGLSSQLGVWYTFTGDGLTYIISTCSNDTTFDTQLTLYQVDDGEGDDDEVSGEPSLLPSLQPSPAPTDDSDTDCSLECVTGNDDNVCPITILFSTIEAELEDGVQYYIYVHGFRDSVGDFELSLELAPTPAPTLTPAPTVAGDSCASAIDLVVGSQSRSTDDSTFDSQALRCDDNGPTDFLGVWYTFTGDGLSYTLTTCSRGTTYDTQLSLYEGSCSSLECVASNDDDPECDLPEIIEDVPNPWSTIELREYELGVQYYIFVHGYIDAVGDFDLIFEAETTPAPTPEPTNSPPGSVQQSLILLSSLAVVEFIGAIFGLILALSVLL